MFTGWLRKTRRHRWRAVCQGATLDDTHGKLLKVAEEQGVTDSLCRTMTPAGRAITQDAPRHEPE